MAGVIVAVPTRGRARSLERALATLAPQTAAADARLLVVLDGPDPEAERHAAAHGAQVVCLDPPRGLNAARNAAIDAADPDTRLIVLCDDDVEAPPGWLAAYRTAERLYPDHDVLGGPIEARLEGGGPRHCGAEPPPITSLDLGRIDTDTRYVWGANLALRPRAVARAGRFDERLNGRGDEEEWLDRLAAAGGRVRYVADAGLVHRRDRDGADLRSLLRAGYHTGRAARANDRRKGARPTVARELRDLAGALHHAAVRRCAFGLCFAAHSAGRLVEAADPRPVPEAASAPPVPAAAPTFESGQSGYVAGPRRITVARTRDVLADVRRLPERRRLSRDAAAWAAPRQVLVLALERADRANLLDPALAELARSRHTVTVVRADAGDRGRFTNLNRLAATPTAAAALAGADWLVVIDDDVRLPSGFLDRFLFLAERHDLALAQPAHRAWSHAAWAVTRRRAGAAVRETAFVEIGPLVALHRRTHPVMLPFPEPRIGWGVDAYWGALARQEGWRVGVVDATAIAHRLRPIAAAYDPSAAQAESRAFLSSHPHLTAAEAARTLRTHPRW